uniref:glycerophosphodiester phosphodiesterase n=1 Tax=Kalanchoe fedtschenkoi TaxID=63787 RepID=A0A7N0RG88_KALFE
MAFGSRSSRRQQRYDLKRTYLSNRRFFRLLLVGLAFVAIFPPVYFHFRLKRFQQMRSRRCGWLDNPPLVCAHGGDSTNAFPNTMAAYKIALGAQVDCIEVDASRSSDGVLFALHDRDLQRLSGNSTARVGFWSSEEIKRLWIVHASARDIHDQRVPTIEDSLLLISSSVRKVILDAKVGPPLYEKDAAKDILSVVKDTHCKNCLVWAKSDILVRDMIKLSTDVETGYIVMEDTLTETRSNLLRMKNAGVVGVYHPLIDEKLVQILHGRNKKVYAWTVDDEDSMRRMLLEHVDAVVTSNPTLLQQIMQDARTKCLEEGYTTQ